MVVIGIIALILSFGLPAFNSMSADSRASQARQQLAATMNRAALISTAERTMMAVRAVPASWLYASDEQRDATAGSESIAGRQALALYRYTSSSSPPPNAILSQSEAGRVHYYEFFKQEPGPATLLPRDMWIAPSEALIKTSDPLQTTFDGDAVLRGFLGTADARDSFAFNPKPNKNLDPNPDPKRNDLLNADDFLIVFDPQIGVLPTMWRTSDRQGPSDSDQRPPPWRLSAFAELPRDNGRGIERMGDEQTWNAALNDFSVKFERYHFGGIVLYKREPFATLGVEARSQPEIDARRAALRRHGDVYAISRYSGGLLRSEPPAETQ